MLDACMLLLAQHSITTLSRDRSLRRLEANSKKAEKHFPFSLLSH